jgi:hypothetical protein
MIDWALDTISKELLWALVAIVVIVVVAVPPTLHVRSDDVIE